MQINKFNTAPNNKNIYYKTICVNSPSLEGEICPPIITVITHSHVFILPNLQYITISAQLETQQSMDNNKHNGETEQNHLLLLYTTTVFFYFIQRAMSIILLSQYKRGALQLWMLPALKLIGQYIIVGSCKVPLIK